MVFDVVNSLRSSSHREVLRAGIQSEEIVRQKDRLRSTRVDWPHHDLQVDAGAVLVDLSRHANHLHIQLGMFSLKLDQGGGDKGRAEAVRRTDSHEAGERIRIIRQRRGESAQAVLDDLSRTDRLVSQLRELPSVRTPLERAPAQPLIQRQNPAGNGGVGGLQRLCHRIESPQARHGEQDEQVIRTRKPLEVNHHAPAFCRSCGCA